MVEVNGVYKCGRYEKTWLQSLCVMSNVKIFASTSVECTDVTDYIDHDVSHMDQKKIRPIPKLWLIWFPGLMSRLSQCLIDKPFQTYQGPHLQH